MFTPRTDPKLRMLKNKEKIPEEAICYDVNLGWCSPGKSLIGKRWKRHSLAHPSIIMVEE